MFHSEILASLNLKKKKKIPWIGKQPYTEMLFWQISNIIIYVKIVGKIPDQLWSVWLFSNPRDNVQILVESTGQVCLIVLHIFWTLSPGFGNNHTFKCWSGIFPTILPYMIMLEKCQNNLSVYCWSPIQGTKCYSWMKPDSKSVKYVSIIGVMSIQFCTSFLIA